MALGSAWTASTDAAAWQGVSRPTLPRVCVVMPVHGEQPFVGDQLEALVAQSYEGSWEVVVADNGVSPATAEVIAGWVSRSDRIQVVDATARPGANFARNLAVERSSGDLVAICDSDDVVAPAWISGLAAAAAGAELVGGHLEVESLNSQEVQAWRPSPTEGGLPIGLDFLPYVAGSNCAVWRDVYLAVGGCDEEIGGGGGGDDVDLSWKVQLGGGRIGWAPDAVVAYRLRDDLRSLVGQMATYGTSAALLYKKYRSAGARRSPAGTAAKHWIKVLVAGPGMLRCRATRGSWLRDVAYLGGRLRGAWRHRVLFW